MNAFEFLFMLTVTFIGSACVIAVLAELINPLPEDEENPYIAKFPQSIEFGRLPDYLSHLAVAFGVDVLALIVLQLLSNRDNFEDFLVMSVCAGVFGFLLGDRLRRLISIN